MRYLTVVTTAIKTTILLLPLLPMLLCPQNFKKIERLPNTNTFGEFYGSPTSTKRSVSGKNTSSRILAAKMWNAYSPQSPYTNLIAYDPYSDVVAVVHRSDRTGPGSGYITYNVSADAGATWTPQLGPLNPAGVAAGRHPNILVSNPSKSSSSDNVQILIAENELVGGAFRDVVYLNDSSFSGSLINYFHDSSSVFAYAGAVDYNTGAAYYAVVGSATFDGFVTKTTDKGKTYSKKQVVLNTDALDGDGSMMLEVDKDGTVWYGYRALFPVDTVVQSWRFAYSTDGGANWSTPMYVKVSDIPGRQTANYEWDLISDASGNIHLAAVFGDTATDAYALYDVVLTKAGAISSTKIADIKRTSQALPGGLLALNEPEYARTLDGKSLALKWVDVPAANDTMNDVYIVYKTGGAAWSAAANKSNSTDVSEIFSNMATIMQNNGRLFIYYTVFGPTDLDEAEMWFLYMPISGKEKSTDEAVPDNFELWQNYPNPFNPSTMIEYDLPYESIVDLSVYDILGRRVAVLVHGEQSEGRHQAHFSSDALASGVYLYRLAVQTNDTRLLTIQKKMVIVR